MCEGSNLSSKFFVFMRERVFSVLRWLVGVSGRKYIFRTWLCFDHHHIQIPTICWFIGYASLSLF